MASSGGNIYKVSGSNASEKTLFSIRLFYFAEFLQENAFKVSSKRPRSVGCICFLVRNSYPSSATKCTEFNKGLLN
jgi:hypothetical protein